MKQFNRGDLVTTVNEHSEAFGKEYIYLGFRKVDSGNIYHIVGSTGEKPSTTFIEDEYIKLIATAKHIPVAKFHKGSIAFWKEHEIIVLEERDSDLEYYCYNSVLDATHCYSEEMLSKEKPVTEVETKEEEYDGNKDPNDEHNSNYMKDSMPTLEKKDY